VNRDEAAIRSFESLFPDMRVIPLQCTGLAREGGCFNCISWTIRKKGKKSPTY
jgi:agmatine/peptidylarginine deiminase